MSNLVPDGWSKPRLKEVVTHFQNGYAFSAKGYVESGIPIISMGSIQLDGQFKKVNSKLKFWDSGKKEELSRYLVKPCDLIMAMTDVTPTMELIGRSCIVKGKSEYFLNQRVGLISFDEDEISKEYFSYYTNFNEWRSYCIGSSGLGAQANLGTSQILDGFVTLPPLPEQQKIANILTSVDEVIEKTQAQIDKLKDLKTGMMQELLTHGIGHTEFKDSPVGRIPAEWEVKPLIDVVKNIIDCEHKTAPYVDKSEYLVVRTSNVRNGELTHQDMKFTTKGGFKAWTKRAVPAVGDVLFTREAPAGESCLVPIGLKVCMGQRMVLLRPNKEVVNPNYFSMYLNSELASKEIYELSIGTTVTRINIDDIKKIKCIVPSIAEQKKIAASIDSIQTSILNNQSKMISLANIKKALMQDLLTGKVRVNGD